MQVLVNGIFVINYLPGCFKATLRGDVFKGIIRIAKQSTDNRSVADVYLPFAYRIIQPGRNSVNYSMKYLIIQILFVLCCINATSQTQSQFTLGFADSVSSAILHEQRPLMICTPYTSKKNRTTSTETFPVLYVLDGENNFRSVAAIVERMINSGTCPPMMVVGVPNTNRGRDLTPTPVVTGADGIKNSGGGENFMRFMEQELMPYIAANYPVSSYKLLMGHSLGGLMVINTLVHHPALFNAYVSIDAALWWDDHKIVKEGIQALANNRYENKALFMTMANRMEKGVDTAAVQTDTSGNTELIRYNLELIHFIKQHPENKLRFKYAYYENETHGTVSFISAYNALKFIFDYYAFPIDADHQTVNPKLVSVITEHYLTISRQLGYHVLPDASMLNSLGYRALNLKQFEMAGQLFALNVLNYPKDANLQDSYGDYYQAIGDTKNAIDRYKKALVIKEIIETRTKLTVLLQKEDIQH